MMAAASADVPAVFVPVGPMLVGHHQGEELGACTDCRRLWGDFRAGRIDAGEIEAINGRLAPTPGTCMVMGTASTMACIVETMGLALPLAATIPATHADRLRSAEASGKQAVALAEQGGPTPRALMTKAAFRNALVVLQAIGGSTNGLIHLTAAAGRCGIAIDLDELDRIGHEVPVLIDLKPSGKHYMEHFHWAGGVPRLLAELGDRLDLDAPTVTGAPLRSYADGAERVRGQDVIRPVTDPIYPSGSIAVLRGNLAPRGAIIKQSAASESLLSHTGRAVVFDSVEDMTLRIDSPDLDVAAGDVLVLRNAGPIGAPGMPEAGYLPIPKKLAVQGVKDMVRISDARMSGTAFGTIALHLVPEAAAGGPLALVRERRHDPARRRGAPARPAGRRRRARAPARVAGRRGLARRRRGARARLRGAVSPHRAAGRRGLRLRLPRSRPRPARAVSAARPRGVIAATATPVDAAGAPDHARLVAHCKALLDGGCDAINLLGTTGEATAFGVEQRLAVMHAVADAGLPLDRFMVGTGVPALAETVRLTRAACELGFAGALVLPPFFYPDIADDGLVGVRRRAHRRRRSSAPGHLPVSHPAEHQGALAGRGRRSACANATASGSPG